MTSLNKQALREKFEAWAEEAGALPWGYLKKQRNASGNYSVQIYTYMWHAWSACHESLMDELEAAEKRIAELEARTVTLPDEPFYPDGDIDCPLSVNLVDIKTACDEAGVPLVVRCGK
ncbi:TPA: hypothetical protein ACWH67_003380 [Salmonella enterica]